MRLLIKGKEEDVYEVAHEALFRVWPQLSSWLDASREFLLWRKRFNEARQAWEQSGRDKGALLSGVPLVEAEEWRQARSEELSPAEKGFIQASLARERRTFFQLVGGLVGALILAGVAGVGWWRADISQKNADFRARSATLEVLFDSDMSLDALIHGIKAGKDLKDLGWRATPYTKMQGVMMLRQIVYGVKEYNRLEGHSSGVNGISFSPNGKILASASRDGTVKLWNLDGTLVNTLGGHSAKVTGISFSPDGKLIASISQDGTINLQNPDGTLVNTMKHNSKYVNGWVTGISFSPNGKLLVSGGNTVNLWQLDGTLVKTLEGQFTGGSKSVSFSPDGELIASAGWDHTVKGWVVNLGGQTTH